MMSTIGFLVALSLSQVAALCGRPRSGALRLTPQRTNRGRANPAASAGRPTGPSDAAAGPTDQDGASFSSRSRPATTASTCRRPASRRSPIPPAPRTITDDRRHGTLEYRQRRIQFCRVVRVSGGLTGGFVTFGAAGRSIFPLQPKSSSPTRRQHVRL